MPYPKMNDIIQHIQDYLLLTEGFFIDGEAIAVILQEEKLFLLSKGITDIDLSEWNI